MLTTALLALLVVLFQRSRKKVPAGNDKKNIERCSNERG